MPTYTRAFKKHFKWITKSKRDEVIELLAECARVGDIFIEKHESQIPEHSEFFFCDSKIVQGLIAETGTWLTSRATKNVIQTACGLVKGAHEKAVNQRQPYYRPNMSIKSIRLNEDCVERGTPKDLTEFDYVVTVRSFDSRSRGRKIHIPIKHHRHAERLTQQGRLAKTVTITPDYAQFTVDITVDKKRTKGLDLGVDIGIKKLIAASNGQEFGLELERLIAKLLRCKQYSKAWHRANRTIKEYIDKTVKELPWDELRLIAVEKLVGLKHRTKAKRRLAKNMRRVIGGWYYRRVLTRIQQHCELNRVSFRSVSPRDTSRTCAICGYTDKLNRQTQEIFRCRQCGHTDNADFNAAKNILGRALTWESTLSPVQTTRLA